MQRAKTIHRQTIQNPDGSEDVLLVRVPSWVETRDVRAKLEYLGTQYRQTEMYKQSLRFWEMVKEATDAGEGPPEQDEFVEVPEDEYKLFLEYRESGLEDVIGLVDGIEGGDLTRDEVREALGSDIYYRDALRVLRDVVFFQRGLHESNGRASEDGGAQQVDSVGGESGQETEPEAATAV